MNVSRRLTMVLVASWLAACAPEDPPAVQKAPEGRAETQSIRNTQAIGYDGKAIADKVDATLNANDRHVQQVEQQPDADALPAE